jgi:type IV pilus assembly protein PilX
MTRRLEHNQRGAVLLITLIALVAMAMGALAMYRNAVASNSVIGNIGYRQQGVAATDMAVEAAIAWLAGTNALGLDNHQADRGYYATHSHMLTNGDIFSLNWEQNALALTEQNGYRLWYVIHRLCNEVGAPSPGNCVERENTVNQASVKLGIALGTGGIAPVYRITVRALGPRRSESMVQVITY